MNDDDFDFSEEENEELEREMQKEKEKLQKHPLLKQAKEVLAIVDTLLDTCSKEASERYGSTLRESAMIVVAKLHSGLASDNYLLCVQKAAIIREHGEYLRLSNHMLSASGAFDEKYVIMFRQEMETFRQLFKNWAKEIHQMENDLEDEWGLFLKW